MAQTNYPTTERSINGQLAALLQLQSAEEKLRQSGVAPNTVAGQKVQQAQAMLGASQPQPQPPQQPQQAPGIQAMLPGVRQQAMQAQQAAQPATQGDMDQLRQMMQQAQGQGQPMAEGGIATLPGADVEMAEGGVVGYAGNTVGSYVRSPEEVEQSEGEKESSLQKILNWLRGKGTVYDPEATAAVSPRDELAAEVARESRGKPPPDLARIGAAPQPRVQARPPTSAPVAQPPAQPAAPAGFDYAKILQDMMGAQDKGFQELKELAKPQPKTPEELAYIKQQEEEIARRRTGLESRRQQYLDLEKLREEAGKPGKYEDLAAFFSRAGGARSGLAGLAQATQTQVGIDTARRKEAQAAIDRRREYFDLLEQQRDTVEALNTALSEGNMTRAAAERARLEGINKGIATLRVQTSSQMYGPTVQAAQHAESTRQQLASRERMNRERIAATLDAARLKAAQVKPPPGMGIGDVQKLNEMVSNEFRNLGNDARRIIGRMPNGQQLLRDIDNKNVDLKSESGRAKIAPIMSQAMNLYKQELLGQTKFGAAPIPYSSAASALGLSAASDEDDED